MIPCGQGNEQTDESQNWWGERPRELRVNKFWPGKAAFCPSFF
jgi:hypothetical protein